MRNLFFPKAVAFALLLLYLPSHAQWILTGNSNAVNAKLGTTNANPLRLFTNNLERMRIDTAGIIGIGTITPDGAALLDLASTSKGFLVPRMTTAQRNAISSPVQGLLIFQTDGARGFYFFDVIWKAVTPSTSNLANRTLSNLTSPTAINVDLLPGITNFRNVGSAAHNWKNLYLNGQIFKDNNRILDIDSVKRNTFLGINAGAANTTARDNTGIGFLALQNNTTGRFNTAIGSSALVANTTGFNNSAFGNFALFNNTIGIDNTACGFSALGENTEGNSNTAFGSNASFQNSTGNRNTAIGIKALLRNTTQDDNTAVGFFAGTLLCSQSTFLGSGASSTNGVNNAMALGYHAQVNTSNKIVIGNTSVTSISGNVSFTTFSDGSFKRNVKENVPGLSFINQLRPVTYTLDVDGIDKANEKAVGQSTIKQLSSEEITGRQEKEKIVYTGFVAQEVEKAARKLNYDFSGVDAPKNNNDFYGLRYSDFVVPLVKAVQELSKENEELKKKNDDLEIRLKKLEDMVTKVGITSNSYTELSNAYLEQNTPNPFNSVTIIRYHLPSTVVNARVLITDMNGNTIKSIVLANRRKGELTLNGGTLAAGSYNYTLWMNGKQVDSKNMMITK